MTTRGDPEHGVAPLLFLGEHDETLLVPRFTNCATFFTMDSFRLSPYERSRRLKPAAQLVVKTMKSARECTNPSCFYLLVSIASFSRLTQV